MTVKELIADLADFPSNAIVVPTTTTNEICTIKCAKPITLIDNEDDALASSAEWIIYVDDDLV